MKTHLRPFKLGIVRGVDAGSYLESFFVSAVAAILVIRLFLHLAGYPQLGGEGLHIAHMLWGGLLMLLAIVLLLSLLGHVVKTVAAILGGVGFGIFIDELGKFITSDNDYFFKPTIALIYVLFVLLFLLFRLIERRWELSQQELLANASDLVVDALVNGASREDVAEALHLLQRSGASAPVAQAIRQAIVAVPPAERTAPPFLVATVRSSRRYLDRFVGSLWFQRLIIALFVVHALLFVSISIVVVAEEGFVTVLVESGDSVAAIGEIVASVVSSMMVVVGVVRLAASKVSAYRWFRRSILISIFFIQVFSFYENQLGAIFGLALDLLLLAGLNYAIDREQTIDNMASLSGEPR